MRIPRLSGLLLCTILVAAVVAGGVLAGCRSGETTMPNGSGGSSGSTTTGWSTTASDLVAGSMKGYELYSWQDGDQWYFSVLVGTNRNKTLDEIRSPGSAFKGAEALEAALKTIPAGQWVTWFSGNTLAFPPDEVVAQVQQVCKDRGLNFNVTK
jgi:hypothetical protein